MTPDVSLGTDDHQIVHSAPDSKSAAPVETEALQHVDPPLCPNYVRPSTRSGQPKANRSTLHRRLLKTREAAAYLATSEWKIRELVRDGELPVIDDGKGGPWRFDVCDLDTYIEQHRQRTA